MRVNLDNTKMTMSGLEEKVTASKIDPCGACGKRAKVNAVFCTNCARWVHGWCTSIKKVTPGLAKNFVSTSCTTLDEDGVEPIENLHDEVETVNEFCYLEDKLKTNGGCEAAVTARTKIGWIKFRECSETLLGKRLSFKIKAEVFQSCVWSAMLHGSETWCLKEKKMNILRRTERAMVRAMCGAKLAEEKYVRYDGYVGIELNHG